MSETQISALGADASGLKLPIRRRDFKKQDPSALKIVCIEINPQKMEFLVLRRCLPACLLMEKQRT